MDISRLYTRRSSFYVDKHHIILVNHFYHWPKNDDFRSRHGINSKHNTRHTEHVLNRQHRSLRDNERNVPGYLYRFR
ncbi:hypothetical protein, partial [Oenococcus oeni]|uniref:hypothetical protein n=2 Tax=Oenococcus oeni TaxID=1247 RepID=UPI0039C9A434